MNTCSIPKPGVQPRSRHARSAFTLIELLVTIAIISVLMGILIPTLASARTSARRTAELSAIRQLGMSFAAYTQDNKDTIMPGYLRGLWANPGPKQFAVFRGPGDSSDAARLSGTPIRSYPLRLMPYLAYNADALVTDNSLRSSIRSQSTDPAVKDNTFSWLGRNPSFGMNTTFVGGDAHRGAFFLPSFLRWTNFYVTQMHQAKSTGKLLIFASSRGTLRTGGQVVPGYHRIEAPWRATPTSNSVPAFYRPPVPAGRFNPDLPTTTYGHVDYRYSEKAVVSAFDGHADLLSMSEMQDMRRWANGAKTADWHP